MVHMLDDSYGIVLQVEYGLLNVLQTKMFYFGSNDFFFFPWKL